MRSRGWGPRHCLGSNQLIGTRIWDLGKSGRGRDRQTERWTRGVCHRDKNRPAEGPAELKPETERERERDWKSHSGETNG